MLPSIMRACGVVGCCRLVDYQPAKKQNCSLLVMPRGQNVGDVILLAGRALVKGPAKEAARTTFNRAQSVCSADGQP